MQALDLCCDDESAVATIFTAGDDEGCLFTGDRDIELHTRT